MDNYTSQGIKKKEMAEVIAVFMSELIKEFDVSPETKITDEVIENTVRKVVPVPKKKKWFR